MEGLKDKIIKEINVFGDYHDNIQFLTDGEQQCYNAYGDCCSSSFFSEILNPQNILGQKITEVKEIDLEPGEAPIRKGTSEDDHEQIYGIHITSEKGTCTIIFRNHSNGYYGGSIMSIHHDIPANTKIWNITEDWSAPSL